MTRHQRFDVRVAPEIERALKEMAAAHGAAAADSQRMLRALRRLREEGVWACEVQKLQSLDLWEVRAGEYRLFFCPIRGTRRLAVGAMVRKSRQRLPMRRLRRIESRVHRWCIEVEEAT